jgi:predicted restriction endonuclease
LKDDASAETSESDPDEVVAFQKQIEIRSYSVADSSATTKTRGSAQRAFANVVKSNYEYRCAITGIETNDFLVAAHIVPWSEDQSIRLDPSNGICLSLLMDRAFEKGYLLIEDDRSIRINWLKVGSDAVLRRHLEPYDGQKLAEPKAGTAHAAHLERRRALVSLAS